MTKKPIFEKVILDFFKFNHAEVITRAPARINLIAPLDAVEADYWSPAMAISSPNNPLAAYCYIKSKKSPDSTLKLFEISSKFLSEKETSDYQSPNWKKIIKTTKSVHFKLNNLFKNVKINSSSSSYQRDIVLGSLEYLFHKFPEFKDQLKGTSIEIGIINTIPRQSGIGGSSSMIIALLWAVGCYSGFDKRNPESFSKFPFNKDIIAELATEIENLVLKNTAGYGDRYTISRGGIGFTSYVGKKNHDMLGEAPLAVYDRIDLTYNITNLPILLAFSGVTHNSGDIHNVLRRKYLEEDEKLNRLYEKLSEISWKSRFSLMSHKWKELGVYFSLNSDIVEEIMVYCGFKSGIGWGNKILIDLISDDPDVYSVKLTGAGGGGSVFALTKPESKGRILKEWKYKLESLLKKPEILKKKYPNLPPEIENGLKNAMFFEAILEPNGVQILQ